MIAYIVECTECDGYGADADGYVCPYCWDERQAARVQALADLIDDAAARLDDASSVAVAKMGSAP